ncbi:MAG: hypothetical protein C0190_01440 [Thermodesulfobacterium geofontis]|uniref:Uncharacterized protein n=1 Tax=Thermodesulfobacterium geofontis TaxID=1295609 RepID=A0A2N7QF95_9BACT|nr:MAG: hypothetical protein C0190_01440 [Thermodesulfobacterium geofontis]PMP97485.1 MAG: hypothetical protein C0169_02935 [Thermodesulfobacterium geofontis]
MKIFNSQYILPFILWILLSIRIYPSNILETILHSGKIFIGCGLYGLGMTIIINGLLTKFAKKTLKRESFIKIALWLTVITALAASLEFYFGLRK